MANSFSGDANCVSVWRLENGSLLTDSVGSNTLALIEDEGSTIHVASDTTNYKEGAGSAKFQYWLDNIDGWRSVLGFDTVSDIPADFPLSTTDADQLFSFSCWVRPTHLSTSAHHPLMMGRWTHTAAIALKTGTIEVWLSTGTGVSWIVKTHAYASLAINQWYHFGLAVDGVNGTYTLRVWNETGAAATTFSGTFTGPLHALSSSTGNFWLGYNFDGQLDEVGVFNDLLTTDEIDLIRGGTYGADDGSNIIGSGRFEISGEGIVEFSNTSTTSLVAAVGDGGIGLSGIGIVSFDSPLDLSVVGTGGVNLYGYGITQYGTPTGIEIIGVGGIGIGGGDTTSFGDAPSSLDVVGSGGFRILGAGEIAFGPDALKSFSLVGTSGVSLSGAGTVVFTTPSDTVGKTLSVVGTGGVYLTGFGVTSFTGATSSDIPSYSLVGSGGVWISGEGTTEYTTPKESEVSVGGLSFSGFGTASFSFPSDLPSYSVVGTGGTYIGGEGILAVLDPSEAPWVSYVGTGGVGISGSGITAFTGVSELPSFTQVGTGGLWLYGSGTVSFTVPTSDPTKVFSAIGSGGLKFAASAAIEFTSPAAVVPGQNLSVTGTGGLYFTGDGLLTETSPEDHPYDNFIGFGGVELSGGGIIAIAGVNVTIPTLEVVGTGGFKVQGEGVVAFTGVTAASEIPSFSLTGSGGYGLSGYGTVTYSVPTSAGNVSYIGTGGVKLGGGGVVAVSGLNISLPATTVVGAGGFSLAGEGPVTFTTPDTASVVTSAYSVVGSGGFALAGVGTKVFGTVETSSSAYTVVGSGGFSIAGEGAATFVSTILGFSLEGSGGLLVGDTSGLVEFSLPDALSLIGNGGVLIDGSGFVAESQPYETWALTGIDYHPSVYTNYAFDSYGEINGQFYGAKSDGIYLLDGADDNGTAITTGLILGPSTLGSVQPKRLRHVHVPGAGSTVQIQVDATDDGTVVSDTATITHEKGYVSRLVQGPEITIRIKDFNRLSNIEIQPVILSDR